MTADAGRESEGRAPIQPTPTSPQLAIRSGCAATKHNTYYAQHREQCIARSKARYQTIKHAISQAAKAARASHLSQRRLTKSKRAYADRLASASHLRSADLKQFVKTLKASTPCLDCRQSFPSCVMDFDHVRGKKTSDVSDLLSRSTISKARLLAELANCELVCANCHRIRTAFRQFGVAE